jgi:hypothetical protein
MRHFAYRLPPPLASAPEPPEPTLPSPDADEWCVGVDEDDECSAEPALLARCSGAAEAEDGRCGVDANADADADMAGDGDDDTTFSWMGASLAASEAIDVDDAIRLTVEPDDRRVPLPILLVALLKETDGAETELSRATAAAVRASAALTCDEKSPIACILHT